MGRQSHVVVVGAGITGAATALALASRGLRVSIFDQASAGTAVSGASLACIGTHMNSEVDLNQLIWGAQIWRQWDSRFGGAFHYRQCGQLRFITKQEDIAVAEQWIALERAAGLAPRLLSDEEIRDVEPDLQAPLVAASWSPSDALVNPFLAVRTLLSAAMDAGASFFDHRPVTGLDVEGDRIRAVLTGNQKFDCDAVVLAGGPWTADLLGTIGVDVPMLPRRAQCLATVRRPPTIRGVIGASKSERGGVDAGYTQIQQSEDGQILFNTVLAGGLSEPGAQNIVPQVQPRFVSDSIAMLVHLFPGLAEVELLRSWVRYEAVTPDGHFLAGPVGPRGVFVAAGDNGTGFGRAPIIAEVIAAAVSDTECAVDAGPYDPARFAQSQSIVWSDGH